ncbi:hypothetical protein [Roseobacter sinensis]|uniref:Uncharacterized protein n=1 Tax=Roseobacter sinensis TaxID=2931391 RepID=A0ABT3BEQ7_9RHOB|nr:hypothetical protein [Roseobacter sp. WL0113]MCV3272038.1 hypothetical protein [Roseobacter sp. WL0113]
MDARKVMTRSLVAVLTGLGTAAASETVYVLRTADLECLSANTSAYLAEDKVAYVISLPSCPETAVDFRDYVTNSAPDFELEERAHDALIVLTRPQLECLADAKIDRAAPFHRLWPARCLIEASTGE